ncbi:hypothetical protein EIB71_10480 [Kaistella daneshvariae]|uniref:Four helix bundle protein n=1 Tax=Kaistella daneshvariae TaxID=2487074 RepID=A0ABN5T0C8_9FLAO|nr:hypothetical protein [Kaistella daneshvariae]AZI68067.1 hypothetical protein EIB71_10480 [Kaistella daneshvariae]
MGKVGQNFKVVNSVILHDRSRTIMRKIYVSKLLFNLIKACEIANERDNPVDTQTQPYLSEHRKIAALTNTMCDIDQVLKDCKNYIDKYVYVVQTKEESVHTHDFSEYSALIENGRELAKNLKKAKSRSQLSFTQAKKLQQIQVKLAEAMDKRYN